MTEEVKPKGYKKLIIGIIAVAIIVTLLFVPMIPVKEPYKLTEQFNRQCKYEVVSAKLQEGFEWFGKWVYHSFQVTIKNIDSKDGTFTVECRLYNVMGLRGTKTISEYLGAGETKTFRADFDTNLGEDVRGEYSVSAPTVIDERLVTKQKTVYKSIIELLIYG